MGECTCGNVWNWIIMILTWLGALFLVLAHIFNLAFGARIASIVCFSLCYLIYFINCFCSHTFSYLNNQTESSDIYETMQKLFYTPAYLVMHVECYHYETRTTRTKHGTRTRRVKVVTHVASERVYFKSWRDISG